MNTKDVLALVERKYKIIEEEAIIDVNKRIGEATTEKERIIEESTERAECLLRQLLEDSGIKTFESKIIGVNTYKIKYPKIADLELEKKKIKKEIEKEKMTFINEIIVLGIKNEKVKNKIMSLLNK